MLNELSDTRLRRLLRFLLKTSFVTIKTTKAYCRSAAALSGIEWAFVLLSVVCGHLECERDLEYNAYVGCG